MFQGDVVAIFRIIRIKGRAKTGAHIFQWCIKTFSIIRIELSHFLYSATQKAKIAIFHKQAPLHAHATIDLFIDGTTGIVMPLEFSGDGIQGDDVGSVIVCNPRSGIHCSIFNQYATGNGPRGNEFAEHCDPPLSRRHAVAP